MSLGARKALVNRALEYSIFSNTPLIIQLVGEKTTKLNFQVRDVGEKCFSAVPIQSNAVEILSEWAQAGELMGMLPYKRHLMLFETRIIRNPSDGLSSESSEVRFFMPSSGTLTNRREFPRTSLQDGYDDVRAELEVDSRTRKLVFKSSALFDISQSSIALGLNREVGLVLPDDRVTSLRLFRGEDLILHARGEVVRVDPKIRDFKSGRNYLAVVTMTLEGEEPGRVPEKDRRKSNRAYLLDEKSIFVSATHPLFREHKFTAPVVDVSTSGLSFLMNTGRFPLVTGTVLREFEIQLPQHPRFQCGFQVVGSSPAESTDGCLTRIRGRLLNLSPALMKAIHQTIQTHVDPKLVDATSDDYDQLWEFLFETGFIYSNKRRQIQEYANQLFKTYTMLLKTNSPIVRKILFKEGGEIRGHLSGIRFFDNAWLIQHLNASRSGGSASAAQAVLKGMADFFLDSCANETVGSHYLICYYRPDNLYPAILFGETRNYIADPSVCDIEDMDFCLLKEGADAKPELHSVDGSISVCEASSTDLEETEDLLVEQGHHRLVRIEGLTSNRMLDFDVANEFEKLKLYRFRKVFVARDKQSGGFSVAICNFASPGVNLSELTNSFRLFFSSSDRSLNSRLANEVCREVLAAYANTQMTRPVLLLGPKTPLPRQFERIKTYRYWFIDTAGMARFREASLQVFGNLKDLVKKYKYDSDLQAAG